MCVVRLPVSDEVAYGKIQQGSGCVDLDIGQLPVIAKLRQCVVNKDSQVSHKTRSVSCRGRGVQVLSW